MTQFRTFEEMNVWKEARELTIRIVTISKKLRAKHEYELASQIKRAARSIGANIAEGNDSLNPREFMSFLGYAKRSSAEVRAHLYDVLDEECISNEEFEVLSTSTKKIAGMLAKLIQHLQNSNPNMKRTQASNHKTPITYIHSQ